MSAIPKAIFDVYLINIYGSEDSLIESRQLNTFEVNSEIGEECS
jgi:hypothetical protein